MCDCIHETNLALGLEHNAMLVTTMLSKPARVVVRTEQILTQSRKKPPHLLATYCPFCGEPYALSPTLTQHDSQGEA